MTNSEAREIIIKERDSLKANPMVKVEDCLYEAFDVVIKVLEQQPKTGHWIADVEKWGDVVTTVNGYRCDRCNTFNTDKDNYCPNCGAKMEVEDDNE